MFQNFHPSVLIESLECCSHMWDLAEKDILSEVLFGGCYALVLTPQCLCFKTPRIIAESVPHLW